MKTTHTTTSAIAAALTWAGAAVAELNLNVPNPTADGPFNPPVSVEVDLSQAVTGAWSDAQLPANVGRGIYDPDQWAVVFKYSSVNIRPGVTVTFKNHPSRAPVVWLVDGNVTIVGPGMEEGSEPALNLNGKPAVDGEGSEIPAEPGPGGFRGGARSPILGQGAGLGIGGGTDANGTYIDTYGNPRILPLIGGSGGNAGNNRQGGSGGGAIFIAARDTLSLSGRIHANAGPHLWATGSGGAVRIVADAINGDGEIQAIWPGATAKYNGRLRLETNSFSTDIATFPETIAVSPDPSPALFPPPNAPKVRILSVDGAPAPAEPTADLTNGADIGIENDDPVEILVETTNFPIEGAVQVRYAWKYGGYSWVAASYVNGNNARATWSATLTFQPAFATLQARATAP